MRKLSVALFSIIFGLLFSTSIIYAEMTKEGSGEIRGAKSGTIQRLAMGEGRTQMNYEETGVILDAPEDSPFFHATFHGIGTLQGHNGKFIAIGGMVFTLPNGDQIYAIVDTRGQFDEGVSEGSVKFVGGTGECAGIEGKMLTKPRPKTKSSKEGVYQQIVLSNVTWKIP